MYSKEDQLRSNRIREIDPNSMDKDIVVRFNKSHPKLYKERQDKVQSISACQICGCMDLDAPHHARFGLGVKDDRYLMCICKKCHYEIHHGSWDNVPMTREATEDKAWENHERIVRGEL